MMMFFYLPLVVLDGLLAAYEANTRLCRAPMPTPKTGEPTVIMME
jgi:hypothetical protein